MRLTGADKPHTYMHTYIHTYTHTSTQRAARPSSGPASSVGPGPAVSVRPGPAASIAPVLPSPPSLGSRRLLRQSGPAVFASSSGAAVSMPQTRRLPVTSDALRHLSLLVPSSIRRSSAVLSHLMWRCSRVLASFLAIFTSISGSIRPGRTPSDA